MATTPRTPSAPLVISLLALVVALVWTPAGQGFASGLSKGAVKKIAAKVADRAISRAAPGLVVGRATQADKATRAERADRAADADALGGVPASGYARRGAFQVFYSPNTWLPYQSTDQLTRTLNGTQVTISTLGSRTYAAVLSQPISANGTRLRLTKIRYCFNVSSSIPLASESALLYSYTAGIGSAEGTAVTNSGLNVQTPGCRVVTADLVPSAQGGVTFVITVNPTTVGSFVLGGITAEFEPTDQPLAPLS